MQEWWPFLAVFWGLYLLDGLHAGRRDRLGFRAWHGRLRAACTQASWQLGVTGPLGWTVLTEDLPCSLSAEGLTNWPSGSASRPPPLPETVQAWRWEQVGKVETRYGWIFVEGVRFAPATAALTAGELARLAEQLRPLDPAARAALLRTWQVRRLLPLRVRRQIRRVLGRTRALAWVNAGQTVVALALTGYVLGAVPERLPPDLGEAIADALPYLMAGYALAHIWAVLTWYRLHRRFWPAAAAERNNQLVTALLVPAQALQLRRSLVALAGKGVHPMTVALAAGDEATVAQLTRDTVADLAWPRMPAGLPPLAEAVVQTAATDLRPLVDESIRIAHPKLDVAALLAPPVAPGEACAYCPRCGDVFVRPAARCPHGGPLQPLNRKAPVDQAA